MKIYVDASARCDGDGSEFRPFKRINEAAKIAVAGDEVLVKPGILQRVCKSRKQWNKRSAYCL